MKKIMISGSSSGIGRGITENLLEQGCQVIGLARDHKKFSPETPNYQRVTLDFSVIHQLEKPLKSLAKEHADVDVVVCCAGYGHFSELEQFSVAQMENIINVNFLSQAIFIKNFLPNLKRNRDSKIIIIGSEAALHGAKKGSLYCASKFALRGFAISLRQECAKADVAVTLINPGMVATPFFDALDFTPGDQQANTITSQQIAELVALVIHMENNCVLEEINLQPLKKVVERKPVSLKGAAKHLPRNDGNLIT